MSRTDSTSRKVESTLASVDAMRDDAQDPAKRNSMTIKNSERGNGLSSHNPPSGRRFCCNRLRWSRMLAVPTDRCRGRLHVSLCKPVALCRFAVVSASAMNHHLRIMTSTRSFIRMAVSTIAAALALTPFLLAQQPAAPPAGGGRGGAPAVVSPEVTADRMVTFRLSAPQAQNVRVSGSDMPALAGGGRGAASGTPSPGQMTKGENGVWSVTLGPIDPGAYRYNFNVDGVTVIDPRNSSISESNTNVWSLVYVPGSDVFDTKQVPHGAVAAVTYYSTALSKFRRMHVYTPPGYEAGGSQKYPIFYLLHGAGDCDEAWTSVGRAGFIFDNLIAAKKIKPMVVVMPAGHTNTTPTPAAARRWMTSRAIF